MSRPKAGENWDSERNGAISHMDRCYLKRNEVLGVLKGGKTNSKQIYCRKKEPGKWNGF